MLPHVRTLVKLSLITTSHTEHRKAQQLVQLYFYKIFKWANTSCRRHRFDRYPLWVNHKQEWGRWFIPLLPSAAVFLGSNAGSDGIELASGFVI